MKKWILLMTLVSSAAQANIVCHGQTQMGPATIDISQDRVTITGAALTKPEVYAPISYQWDGHATALITAPGLAISYGDWYGCIHEARITANFRDPKESGVGFIESIEVAQCSGGSTSDTICHVR